MRDFIESIAAAISEGVSTTLGPPADFLAGYVWNWPSQAPLLAIVLLLTGLFITLRLAFVQVRGFRHAIDITRGKYDDPNDDGDLKHYQALSTALSATVGIGNIAGVGIAIRMGGPGALFWMWVTAFFGMALKFAECTLAIKYRKVHEDGSVSGGPMYYIEMGLGKAWKPMAVFFAALAVICSFGSGNMNQSNTMAVSLEQSPLAIPAVWSALFFATVVAMVIIGGIQRIGRVTSFLAPGMAAAYVLGATVILILNIGDIPSSFALIVTEAFNPTSVAGGGVASFLLTLMWGVRRGLFSNEAGQGSAPIAHATAKTDEPVREGLVASLGPFIDTLVICTMTGLVIISSGAYKDKVERTFPVYTAEALMGNPASDQELLELRGADSEAASLPVQDGRLDGVGLVVFDGFVENLRLEDEAGAPWNGALRYDPEAKILAAEGGGVEPTVRGEVFLTGAELTTHGFMKGLGPVGQWIVIIAVLLFAVSTAISWSYYGDRATEYLFGSRFIPVYRWVFVGFFFLGAILPLEAVWTIGDVALGLMSFPNLIALILLSGSVVAMSKDYFSREQKPDR
ncbi:MAG: sodium:alanine symporter family protein [Acidobacteriota bacterium]|nr:sodium:alanine symporter family protein [Acidobacteriota bacterium]